MAEDSVLWRSAAAHRGPSRRVTAVHEDQSSSEYSSPDLQDDDPPLSPRGTTTDRQDRGHMGCENDSFTGDRRADENQNLRDYQGSRFPSHPNPEEEAYPTSEDSNELRRGSNLDPERDDTDEIVEVARGSIKGRRGKKGLTHAEMAMMSKAPLGTGLGTDETINDDHADERLMASDRDGDGDRNDGGETEEEGEDYREALSPLCDKASAIQRRSLWSECHPVVLDAMKILRGRGAEPNELGYARLASAGKGSIDYIVRKQSITIGRSPSLADCAIKSEGKLLSKRHAKLFWRTDSKEWAVQCLSKKNGIVINGVPVVPGSEAMSVRSRDLVEVGDVAFFFLAATTPVVQVNDIPALERTIRAIQREEDREQEEFEQQKRRGANYGGALQSRYRFTHKWNKQKRNAIERRKRSQDALRSRSNAGRTERFISSKKRALSVASGDTDDPEGLQKSRKRWRRSQKPRSRSGVASGRDAGELGEDERGDGCDPDVTEEEGYDQRHGVWQERPDRRLSVGGGDRYLNGQRELMSNENKRRKKSGSSRKDEDSEYEQSSKHKEDWNKKERTDFGRALFAVGVDPVFDKDGSVAYYDWTRFRKIAELPKKSDLMLEDYYIRMMADVHSLLEEEEREKRTKGPRTKHKPGCDCIVCENTRKSRRKKREEREHSFADDGPNGDSEVGEDADVKSTAKSSDKLVGLVTAQKLRVRLSIHEAARQVMSGAGKAVFEKLREQQHVRDFPSWWRPGLHDRALMLGTAIHGVGQWSDIWNDRRQKAFRKPKERFGDSVIWPSNQAAMKRVREISSAINAELRREAKRAAKEEQEMPTRDKRLNLKQSRKKRAIDGAEGGFSRRRKAGRATEVSGDEYDDVASERAGHDSGESTVESGSENGVMDMPGVSEVLTEDDDVLEMEVEEEMEIEDDEDGDANETEEEDDGKAASGVGLVAKKPAMGVADISTDEEEDDEDNIQYETASDSASE